jgi:hypothetical protein
MLCSGCRNHINGSYTNYNGRYYHSQCFKCSSCERELSNTQFYVVNNQILCYSCYQENAAPKCRKCKKPFPPNIQYKVLPEGYYHAECFCCEGPCSRPMPGTFFISNNKRICSNCFNKYGHDFEKFMKPKEETKVETQPEPKKEVKKEKRIIPIYY